MLHHLLLLATACTVPLSVGSDTAGLADGSSFGSAGEVGEGRGRIDEGDFLLYWQWYSEWDGGTCTEIRLKNEGAAISQWTVTLALDASVTAWSWSDDQHWMMPFGDQIYVEPWSGGSISSGASEQIRFCSEPKAAILDFAVEATYTSGGGQVGGEAGADDDTADDDYPGNDPEETPSSGRLYASDGSGLQLFYAPGGTSEGGDCLALTLLNLTDQTFSIDLMDIAFGEDVEVVDAWELNAFSAGSSVTVLWPSYVADLARGDTYTGTVCLADFQAPRAFSSSYRVDGDAQDTDASTSGRISAGDGSGLELLYAGSGTSNGGDCVGLTLMNLGAQTLSVNLMDITFSGAVNLTNWWNLSAFETSSQALTVLWPSYLADLDYGDTYSGTVCMDPFVAPTSFAAEWTVVP